MHLRVLATTVTMTFLAGCVSFIPSYDAALFKHLSAVSDDLSKIAAAENAVYSAAPSFEKVESIYVDAIANLDEAQKIADGRRSYLKDAIAAQPAALVQQAIGNCRQAVVLQMERQRTAPISREAFSTLATEDVCSVAKTMEARLNKGGS